VCCASRSRCRHRCHRNAAGADLVAFVGADATDASGQRHGGHERGHREVEVIFRPASESSVDLLECPNYLRRGYVFVGVHIVGQQARRDVCRVTGSYPDLGVAEVHNLVS
jgi:hypothetical protein